MTAPGFVPKPDQSLVDRLARLEQTVRRMQQNTAGATTANGGAPLATAGQTPSGIGSPVSAGTGTAAARYDHVHTSSLAAQTDVAVSSPSSGQALTYNSGTGKWNNTTRTLAAESDVTISSPTANQALVYNGTTWTNQSVIPIGLYSRYTTTGTLGAGGGWNTLASFTLAEGSGVGLTLSGGNSWSLGAGIWRVHAAVATNQSTILALNSTTSTASMSTTIYTANSATAVSGWAACQAYAEIRSPSGSPVTVAVTVFTSAAASYVSPNCRVTFEWSPL
ncbi:hypothetical protein [Kutzneria albida]|uniref:Uncharacterized protein n=1 Tax=Kutzneria albida DSM 43870 TaxID=1449976 RepID=W5WJJ6_9PSEU|nr:hypothetical protein [Kutzneria albida]AHH98339.1 hypothetical protein KALB_4977 [Kutzneria albida DSM 43870]